ncbi:MAG: glycoside hydrolase family 127 protein [Planctomycetia bacterium]|nr:glycoside hydrolase family 127 protein [Planctomycetia bacterium]
MKKSAIILAVLLCFPILLFGQEMQREYNAVPFTDVQFTDSFWAPRIMINRVVSVPHNIDWCENQTGRIDNFKIASGKMTGKFRGKFYDDSDVYKILEGFAYTLSAHPDHKLKETAARWIDHIAGAQDPDGYLMCYFKLTVPDKKWTNLGRMHELYCAGHMAEAAVAWKQATGDDRFLNVSKKQMDLICKRYGKKPGQLINVPGHEEIELALVKLYQITGDKKYLEQAKFFIDARGNAEGREKGLFGEQCQDHKPIREQTEIVGHAVRAMYLYAGATDIAGYYRDQDLMDAMKRLWNNVTRQKMYITGGIGSHAKNEGFGAPFFLPNHSAYCETCAAIGMILWAHRMNLATGQKEYSDTMNQVMYNGMLSGYGMNGDSYFYVNPLASKGKHHRKPFFNTACCPSNVLRVIASLPGYAYATTQSPERKKLGLKGDDTIVVNMFVDSTAKIKLADWTVDLVQKTNYPFDGKVHLTAIPHPNKNAAKGARFKIMVPDGRSLSSTWSDLSGNPKVQQKCELVLNDPLPVKRMIANPQVQDDYGHVAIQRGPLVYCFEQCDNEVPVDRIVLAKDPEFKVEMRANFISTDQDNAASKKSPMRTVAVITCKDVQGRTLTAVPYYAWDNRAPGKMSVWVCQAGYDPKSESDSKWTESDGRPILYKELDPKILKGNAVCAGTSKQFQASFDEDSGSSFDGSDPAVMPEGSGDKRIPRATFWDHKGTHEWFQYEFYQPAKISESTVYWFDDTGKGNCRVPQSWKIIYQEKEGSPWKEVQTKDRYSVERNKEIRVRFDPIEAIRIRLDIQLQPKYSGGILKWNLDSGVSSAK